MKTARLWRDPRTGIWKLRRRIPKRYRSVAKQRGETIKITTGTADRRLAERRLPAVLKQWSDLMTNWESQVNGDATKRGAPQALTLKQLHALAGIWYRRKVHEFDADPRAALEWHHWEETWPSQPYAEDGPPEVRPEYTRAEEALLEVFAPHVEELLTLMHVATDDASKRHLSHLLIKRLSQALALHRKHMRGDFSPDPLRVKLPEWESLTQGTVSAGRHAAVSLAGLLDAWKVVASVKPRVIRETQYAVDMLKKFVGHDDAAKVNRDDLIRWRTATIKGGRTNDTWNNRLSMIRQVLARGVSDGKLKANATDGLRLPKSRSNSWLPYSDDDATRILTAARLETQPSLRWAHWVMAFTGMRVGEVLQLTANDIREEDGIHYIAVNEDKAGKSVKNSNRRNVPIHTALIVEGFISYARAIADDGPVFPDKQLDAFGQRGGRGWNAVGKWVRETVGICERRKGPDHSWRHRVEDELRAVDCPEDVRDAILGHARKTTGRSYGVRGEALKRLYRCLSQVPLPRGLEPPSVLQNRRRQSRQSQASTLA